MRYEDWHTHNLLCKHAVGTIEDYIKEFQENAVCSDYNIEYVKALKEGFKECKQRYFKNI